MIARVTIVVAVIAVLLTAMLVLAMVVLVVWAAHVVLASRSQFVQVIKTFMDANMLQ